MLMQIFTLYFNGDLEFIPMFTMNAVIFCNNKEKNNLESAL